MAYAIHVIKPLTTRAEKRGPGERRRRDYQDAMTGLQASMLAPASVGAKTNQSGLLEAVLQRESEQPAFLVSQCTPTPNPGSGAGLQRSNAAGENQSPGLGSEQSYRQIAYNEYLAHAFGLSAEDKGKITEEQEDCTGADASPSTRSHLSTSSMELSFRLSLRERRPKIQLTIPRTRSKTYAAIPQGDIKGQRQDTPKGVSPPSATSRHQVDSGGAPARLSVVSPLSVVEMPKPRRPFSTFSFEEMTDHVPNSEPLLSKSASSDSSDDTGEHDGKSSTHSPHSSVSSLASDPAAVKPMAANCSSLALLAMSPTATRRLDPRLSASEMPRHPRVKRSMTSLKEGANRNKPLPLAPGQDAVRPLNYSTHSLARTYSMQASRKTPGPRCASRQSTSSISSYHSLRSKYTPTDLDAGDHAFKRSGSQSLQPPPQALLSSPTLSQAELELEAHLCSIKEDLPLHPQEVPPIHDPLQIRRGPMHMEPSRNPPSPSPSQACVESSSTYGKMHTKRSVTHVAMQMRPGKELPRIPPKRVSPPVVGSNDKAHRVLGRTCNAATMRRETSADSHWKSSESPHSSPNLSMDDPETPEGERSPLISHATFEEVRQRLELLSPKSDATQDFLELHEKNFPSAGVTPPRQESYTRKPSSATKSINSPSRPIEAATREQGRAGLEDHQTVPHPTIKVTQTPKERHTRRLEPRKRHDRSSTRSRRSTAAKIPPICASFPSPRLAEEAAEQMISAAAAETVLLCILENLGNLQDLFATATVSRGFYRTFKRHELRLMKNALYAMSPAAWELREMSPPFPKAQGTNAAFMSGYTPQLYLQHYTEEGAEQMISAAAAETVLLCILENLGNLQDLFATATVSRGFYRTFKRHELRLMKNALYAMSPAAWELREMSPPFPKAQGTNAASMGGYTPQLYLQHYMRDMYTMIALKSMILNHCESFLRADTITALAGGETERASHIDDAFWRVWTFCRLFGCDTKKEDDIVYQMDWLRGGVLAREQRRTMPTLGHSRDLNGKDTSFNSFPAFGQGNCGGLSAEELYDMTEIWTCLGVLVGGFQGKRELAREFGVFENSDIPVGDIEREDSALEEWTHHLLALAPPTILDVTCPTSPTSATFASARSRGYTSWSPPSKGTSRSTFLKEAVSRVYQEKMLPRHPVAKAASPELSPSAASEGTIAASRQRMAAEIRAKRKDPGFKALLPSEERPMSNFPEVLRKLENSTVITDDSSSTATISSLAPSSQLVASGGSGPTTPSASLHLMHSPSPSFSIHDEESVGVLDTCLGPPQVRDPVDIALDRLIELGFDAKTAGKALAETDTGNNVDFDRALETLVRQRKRDVSRMPNWNYGGAAVPQVSRGPERVTSPKPVVGLGIRGAERYA